MVSASDVLAKSSGKSSLPGLRLARNVVGTVGRVPGAVLNRVLFRKRQSKGLRENFEKKKSKIPKDEMATALLHCEDVAAFVRFPRYITPTKDYTDEKIEGLKGSICISEYAMSWYIGSKCVQYVRFGDSTFQHMFWVVEEDGNFVITIDAYHFAPETDKGSIEYGFAAPNAPELLDKLSKKRFCSIFTPLCENEFTKRNPEATAKMGDCSVM